MMPAIDTSELKKRPPSDEKVFSSFFMQYGYLVVCCRSVDNGELNMEVEDFVWFIVLCTDMRNLEN